MKLNGQMNTLVGNLAKNSQTRAESYDIYHGEAANLGELQTYDVHTVLAHPSLQLRYGYMITQKHAKNPN